MKKIIMGLSALALLGIVSIFIIFKSIQSSLPQMISIQDYKPLLVSEVFDRSGKKIGEFSRDERRTLVGYDKIPKNLVNAFLAAEDDTFFQHKGVNFQAIFRAFLANLKAGRSVQGGSTITQQVAKTLLLSSEKTITRKIKDMLLAMEMEKNLTKEEILYLYLNQIYFGQGAYGVEQASQVYYRKSVKDLTLPEMAILAGLPQAPSAYSPVRNPLRAKERQIYVLRRMADVGFITKEQAETAIQQPLLVYVRETYEETAPFFLETVRQMLVQKLGESTVLDKGIKIFTSLDLDKQLKAQQSVMAGLKDLDKRQGYRGALKNIATAEEVHEFLEEEKRKLILDSTPERTINPDGKFADIYNIKHDKPGTLTPSYIKKDKSTQGVVVNIDDANGLVYVSLPGGQGIIDFETMKWARKPNPDVRFDFDEIKKPSEALKKGDVILVRVVNEKSTPERLAKSKASKSPNKILPDFSKFINLQLDQEPDVEGALISFDQQTQDVLAMVGGSSFAKSEFNRAIQAPRQTGSAYKAIVYAAALDKGYTPATPIMDAPIVYQDQNSTDDSEGQQDSKVWKPSNHSQSFGGDILFRNALIKSLNIPTVKIIEDITVPWSIDYSRRLGIFSPLNPDFTLALGSSSVTLYEMTKVFAEFGRLGKRLRPVLIHKVVDPQGNTLMEKTSLDTRFEKEISVLDQSYEERRTAYLQRQIEESKSEDGAKPEKLDKNSKLDKFIFFQNPDQLIRPTTAYMMTTLLKGVVEEAGGTGGRARAVGREVAGKTGSSNNYFDAWFIGYSPQISTGVWVGFDKERTLGKGEVGGRSALPIWVEYMKYSHENLPHVSFPVPDGIVFANIDSETGRLATARTKSIVRQAFAEGTEPTAKAAEAEETTDFYKQDLYE